MRENNSVTTDEETEDAVDLLQTDQNSESSSSSDTSINNDQELPPDPDNHEIMIAEANSILNILHGVLEHANDSLHQAIQWNEALHDYSQTLPLFLQNPGNLNGDLESPMLSAIPEEYQPQDQELLLNIPVPQINIDPNEEMEMPESPASLHMLQNMAFPLHDFSSNLTFQSESVETEDNWTNWPQLESDETDDEDYEDYYVPPPLPFPADFNHMHCWFYSDDDNDSDSL